MYFIVSVSPSAEAYPALLGGGGGWLVYLWSQSVPLQRLIQDYWGGGGVADICTEGSESNLGSAVLGTKN